MQQRQQYDYHYLRKSPDWFDRMAVAAPIGVKHFVLRDGDNRPLIEGNGRCRERTGLRC
jgi:hypothetical protein